MICPKCGEECTRDMVDVGVGEIPSGPYGCENCHWVEPSVDEVCLGLSDEAMAQPDSDEGAE